MIFNDHSDVAGSHAFLSPSRYHWMNYDEETLLERFRNHYAAAEGTRKHALASECIRLGVRLWKSKAALNRFVNESIGYRMTPDVMLFHSYNAYGTADSISFRDKHLRIAELKTGAIPAGEKQTMGYAALFCLEYDFEPEDIRITLTIYQGMVPNEWEPNPEDIRAIMDTILTFDPILNQERKEMLS